MVTGDQLKCTGNFLVTNPTLERIVPGYKSPLTECILRRGQIKVEEIISTDLFNDFVRILFGILLPF